MSTTTNIPFVKMNGLGNEILVVDLRGRRGTLSAEAAARLAARADTHFDQLMALHDPRRASLQAFVRIYNADGSLSSACGNGTRCIGWLAAEETGRDTLQFETEAGLLEVHVHSMERISVDMGKPRFAWNEIPLSEPFHDTRAIELQIGPIDAPILHSPSVVNVGNPHAIFWIDDDPANYDLGRFGPLLENHPLFPERANISIARITSPESLTMRTWERGTGLTRACGTAACATAVCAARKRLTGRTVAVTQPGGTLHIEWTASDRIIMTGPVAIEHRGTLVASEIGF